MGFIEIDKDRSQIITDIEEFKKTNINDLLELAMVKRFPTLWALKFKPIKNKPMTFVSNHNPFANRPWQEEILNDRHPNKVVQKGRQIGMSELSATEVLYFADQYPNVNIMYTFPTLGQMADFSRTRISPVINASPHLSSRISRDLNNVSTKMIGSSNVFMRTSGDGSQGEGADVDMYCADEYDRMKAGVEFAFKESLSSSKYGFMRRWSTPTIPGMGINALYEKSDQRRYLYKCDHCGTWQEVTINSIVQVKDGFNRVTEEIEDGTYQFQCTHCHKELNRWNKGKWVARYPSRKETRGYFVSQLDACYISADEIKRKELQYPFKQLFYNYVLGEPYANVGLQVTEEDVKRHITIPREQLNREHDFAAYVVGVDWGEPSWCVVLGIRNNRTIQIVSLKKFIRSETEPLQDVRQLISHIKPYKPDIIIADAGYGADKNTELYREFPYAMYSCSWNTFTNPLSNKNFLDRWNESNRNVNVDKTTKMLRTLQAVKQGYIGFFGWNEEMTQVITNHLINVQILDKEKDGLVYQVATRKGPDHLACCLAYALIGVDRVTQYGSKVSRGYQMELVNINDW